MEWIMTHSRPGIPDTLTLEFAESWARQRISEKRFKHVKGVARAAKHLAEQSGCDAYLAELAGWLHDGCKEVKDKDLVHMARKFGLVLHPIEEEYGHLLHGPVAAAAIRDELHVTNEELLRAIAEHTLGAVDMSDLSKVTFLADCLEESRPKSYTDPIWKALKNDKANGTKTKSVDLDLDAAMLKACDLGLAQLLEDHRVIHPRTVDVRNKFLALTRR